MQGGHKDGDEKLIMIMVLILQILLPFAAPHSPLLMVRILLVEW